MKLFCILTLYVIASFLQEAFSQTCPPNLDFETGTFDNWQCSIGRTSLDGTGANTINLVPSPPTPGRHEIITQSTPALMDPFGGFPQLCPYGGNYSVKLGNTGTGAEAEGISYTFTIPNVDDTFSFTYYYAVVFEDPNHSLPQQPRFFVTAYDVATGQLINCASYDYVSNGALPGFQVSPVSNDVLFKNWSPSSIQFAGLGGHTVRLEFKTADCTIGGHFGYAYLDVGTGCSNILATAPYCAETNSVILNAPYGFQFYTWYNEDYTAVIGNQQSITLSPPPATSGTFHVDIVPYPGYGCRDTVDAIVTPLPVPDTPVAPIYTFCQHQNTGPLAATASPDCDLLWYSTAAGGTGSTLPPIPNTSVPGTFYFYVSQKRLFGCESLRKRITVNVVPTPQASFSINRPRQCLNGNQFVFTSNSGNLYQATYDWNFGDGQTVTAGASSVNHVYANAGTYQVTLKVSNAATCFNTTMIPVTVVPKPVADFSFPSLVCEGTTQVTLTNLSSVPGNASAINQWWWNMNGSTSTAQVPAPFLANMGGQYPVKLVATTSEGCRSDTTLKIISVRYRPSVDFSLSDPHCENVPVRFSEASSMPAAANPEYIKYWHWKIDNIPYADRNPLLYLAPGQHHAELVVESDYGCKSISAGKGFVVNIKPGAKLEITDSCVRRTIAYKASDATGTVASWHWNFGNGSQIRPNIQYKNYNSEGSYTLTLVAENIYGCRDTLIRPYTIFENHAFAGRDTIVAKDEPVQLNANGPDDCIYVWTPSLGLNNPVIENPVATLDKDQLYQLDALSKEGCDSRSRINIRRYKGPELYVPTAFTPNNDGLNDILKVFPVGISTFHFFAVYNRLGERLFYTTDYNRGWDGSYKGMPQDPGAYVIIASATDYKGKKMTEKKSVILLR